MGTSMDGRNGLLNLREKKEKAMEMWKGGHIDREG